MIAPSTHASIGIAVISIGVAAFLFWFCGITSMMAQGPIRRMDMVHMTRNTAVVIAGGLIGLLGAPWVGACITAWGMADYTYRLVKHMRACRGKP